MQQPMYQSNNQFILMGVTIFASITAAVIISTLIIMTLMRGEIAGALSSQVQTTNAPTVQSTGVCAMPANETEAAHAVQPASSATSAPMAVSFTSGVHHMLPAVHNSFNNTSTTTTTNNVTNTEVHTKTIINDSYNSDDDTVTIIKDNTVNVNSNNKTIDSNNAVKTNVIGNTVNSNSNNTTNNTTTTATTTNVASNNTVISDSNNTTKTTNVVENHVLSDNTTVIIPKV